jgi:branched-chain amino acid transport system substrate-binding protein
LLELAGEDAIGAYITKTSFEVDTETTAYQTYLLSYQDMFGEQPGTEFHPFAYDATKMLLGAIESVAVQQPDGTLLVDREAIRARLFNMKEYPGVTGSLSCSPTGDCANVSLRGRVYTFVSGNPNDWNPGVGLTANPDQVWPKP